jgi:hypothetical protein
MPLFLPGSGNQELVNYDVVDGVAVIEGDILLGPAQQLPFRYGIPWLPSTSAKSAVATANRSHIWPSSTIPYVIDNTVGQETRGFIQWAVAHVSTTELKMRPAMQGDRDYVVFNAAGDGCSSYLGRIGGAQEIQVADCARGSVVHEIMHAAGFYHEQSRGDRDAYLTIVWEEISPDWRSQFDKRDGRGQDIGPYDYGSIMHYSSRAGSRTGRPTMIPKVPNATIGQREGLSQLDRAAVSALYGGGAPPSPQPAVVPPPSTPQPTTPVPPPQQQWSGSFAGSYTSNRGEVGCTQSGGTVTCQYAGGSMLCSANGAALECGWSGGGQGRAVFQRQASGVVAGTYGDFLSTNSRGQWDLTPAGPSPMPQAPPSPAPTPQPTAGAAPLAGSYASTRGPMTCSENAAALACTFDEQGTPGRLDCQKDATSTSLACSWITFFPRPGTGRAAFTRRSASDRTLTGTWGHFTAPNGGGTWDMTGQ